MRLSAGERGARLASPVEFEITRLAFSLGPDDSFIDIRFSYSFCLATGNCFNGGGPAAYSSAMLPCPSRAAVAALSLLTLIASRPTFASASFAPPSSPDQVAVDNATTSPNPEGYQPYLAYPHGPRRGHAFLPLSPYAPVHPLVADLSVPEEPTNPAYPPPQWANNRHPLYTPGQPPPRFTTEEFQFQPERLDKRAVVSSVDVPFPPSSCTHHRPCQITAARALGIAVLMTLVRAQGSTSMTCRRSPPWHRLQSHACRPGTKTEFSSTSRMLCGRVDRPDEPFLARWTGWWQTPVLGMAYTNLDLALGNKGSSEVPIPPPPTPRAPLLRQFVILGAAQLGRSPKLIFPTANIRSQRAPHQGPAHQE